MFGACLVSSAASMYGYAVISTLYHCFLKVNTVDSMQYLLYLQ